MATTFTPAPIDLGPILVALARAPRSALERLIDEAIDRLDLLDGDTDVEMNGDERDGNNAEDDFWPHSTFMSGPGCPIADPDLAVDDERCDCEEEDLEQEAPLVPVYGIDQTKTPTWGGRA